VIATFTTYRSEGHRWYPKFPDFFGRLLKRVHVRLAVSEAAKRTVAAHFPGDYEVVPCAIDVERFAAPAPRPETMPADWRHVLYVGRMEPRKGVDRLVRAMVNVQTRVPCARLVIVGGGPGREEIETLARRLEVRVVFAGRVSDDDLPAYYQHADVVCSPALADESFGIVLLEAMAAGRPIVATSITGYSEWLGPAGCARFADVGDVDTLTRELLAVLEDSALARTLGERGAREAKKYDWNVVAKRLEAIYRAAVESAKLKVESSK
jgi:phosphatidylinositol alpha-mannosyltransferase